MPRIKSMNHKFTFVAEVTVAMPPLEDQREQAIFGGGKGALWVGIKRREKQRGADEEGEEEREGRGKEEEEEWVWMVSR
jgi:hypothetical protein